MSEKNDTPITANLHGRRTVTSASSRLRRSRKEHELPFTKESRQHTTDFQDVTDEELREKRKQKLDHPKVMQKMYEKACVKYKVVPVRQYWEIPDTHIINLTNYNLGPQGVQALSIPLMLHESITKLDLSGNDMGVKGAKGLVEALHGNTSLTELNLAENKLQTEGAIALKEFLREHPCLEKLNLSGNGFKDDDSCIFSQVMKENQRLKHVDFSHNQFAENAGLQFRYVMSDTENLETFNISWNHLRRKGAMDLLAGVKKNYGLRSLDVSFNGFASEGAAVMANVLKKNRTLQEVDMRHNRLLDSDVINIAEKMDCNDALRVLKLGDNHFTQAGAIALLTTLLNPENVVSLELLDLGTTCVDEEFDFIVNELRASRQNLKIIYGKVMKKKRFPAKPTMELVDESLSLENGVERLKTSPNMSSSATEVDDLVFTEEEARAEKASVEKSLLIQIENANRKYVSEQSGGDDYLSGLPEKTDLIIDRTSKPERENDKKTDEIRKTEKENQTTRSDNTLQKEESNNLVDTNDKNDMDTDGKSSGRIKNINGDQSLNNGPSFDPKNLFVLHRQTFIEKEA